jgi:transcriptional regulator with GAF, ATPase, and Fis domain
MAYDWPGNVRELENIIERGLIVSPSNILEEGDWLPAVNVPASPEVHDSVEPSRQPVREMSLESMERKHILDVLERTQWKVRGDTGAAKVLHLNPTTLEARMKRLGIVKPARQ